MSFWQKLLEALLAKYGNKDVADTAAQDTPQNKPVVVDNPQTVQPSAPSPALEPEFPQGTIFLHADVSAWKRTATLSVTVNKSQIALNYDKAGVWPGVNGLNANPWVIVRFRGKDYAATWEWLRTGQTVKE